MSNQLFEYAKNRFVNPSKITAVSVYSKQSQEVDDNGQYVIAYRVAIELDVKDATKATVYSDAYPDEISARNFALKVPVGQD